MSYNKTLTSTVYIINNDRVLLHMHKKYNTWFPVGGHIEADELPHEAAIREAMEESGLNISLICNNNDSFSIGLVERIPNPIAIYREGIGSDEEFLDFIYVGIADSDTLNPRINESNTFRWFSMKELQNKDEKIKIHIRNTAIRCLLYADNTIPDKSDFFYENSDSIF